MLEVEGARGTELEKKAGERNEGVMTRRQSKRKRKYERLMAREKVWRKLDSAAGVEENAISKGSKSESESW